MEAGKELNQHRYDLLVKVVLVGDSGTGKSQILSRFAGRDFNTEFQSTIGVDFANKRLEAHGKRIRLQVWDTATAHERHRAVSSAFYRGSLGVIIVFSLDDPQSFVNVSRWLQEVREALSRRTPVLLFANKSDAADQRSIRHNQVMELVREENLMFIEGSALEDYNIEPAFQMLTQAVLSVLESTPVFPQAKSTNKDDSYAFGYSKDLERIRLSNFTAQLFGWVNPEIASPILDSRKELPRSSASSGSGSGSGIKKTKKEVPTWAMELKATMEENDMLLRFRRMSSLAATFEQTAGYFAALIVSELSLPDSLKTIKPVEKVYKLQGLEMRVCNGDVACKEAEHELKGLNSHFHCGVEGIQYPWMAIVDYLGVRVVATTALGDKEGVTATPSLSIGQTSPLKGRQSVQPSFLVSFGEGKMEGRRSSIEEAEKKTETIESALGLRGTPKIIPGAIMQFSKLFPRQAPLPCLRHRKCSTSPSHQLLRPEFVRSFDETQGGGLHCGVFTEESKEYPTKSEHEERAAKATLHLLTTTIPKFALELDNRTLESQSLEFKAGGFTCFLHTHGINVRFLGFVWVLCLKEKARQFVYNHMVARIVKNDLKGIMCSPKIGKNASPSQYAIREGILSYLNSLMDSDQQQALLNQSLLESFWMSGAVDFYQLGSKEECMERFAQCPLDFPIIFRVVENSLGIKLSARTWELLNGTSETFQFAWSDIEEIVPVVKGMNLTSIATAINLSMEAVNTARQADDEIDSLANRTFMKSIDMFQYCAKKSPGALTFHHWGAALHNYSLFNRDPSALSDSIVKFRMATKYCYPPAYYRLGLVLLQSAVMYYQNKYVELIKEGNAMYMKAAEHSSSMVLEMEKEARSIVKLLGIVGELLKHKEKDSLPEKMVLRVEEALAFGTEGICAAIVHVQPQSKINSILSDVLLYRAILIVLQATSKKTISIQQLSVHTIQDLIFRAIKHFPDQVHRLICFSYLLKSVFEEDYMVFPTIIKFLQELDARFQDSALNKAFLRLICVWKKLYADALYDDNSLFAMKNAAALEQAFQMYEFIYNSGVFEKKNIISFRRNMNFKESPFLKHNFPPRQENIVMNSVLDQVRVAQDLARIKLCLIAQEVSAAYSKRHNRHKEKEILEYSKRSLQVFAMYHQVEDKEFYYLMLEKLISKLNDKVDGILCFCELLLDDNSSTNLLKEMWSKLIANQQHRVLDMRHINRNKEAVRFFLSQCKHVERVIISAHSRRKWTQVLDTLPNLQKLVIQLDIQECQQIQNRILENLSKFQLQSIDISKSCSSDEDFVTILQYFPHVKTLNISGCKNLTDNCLLHLSESTLPLENLFLDSCKFSESGLQNLKKYSSSLKTLSLSNSSHIPASVLKDLLKECTDLQVLNLNNCPQVADDCLSGIGTSIQCLSLNGCSGLTDYAIHQLHLFPQLNSLDIGNCKQLTGTVILKRKHKKTFKEKIKSAYKKSKGTPEQYLAILIPQLQFLNVENIQNFKDILESGTVRSEKFSSLNVGGLDVSAKSIRKLLGASPQLSSLNMRNCQWTYSEIAMYGSSIQYLDLSQSSIQFSYTEANYMVENCHKLKILNLSDVQFMDSNCGPLMEIIKWCKSLEELHIYNAKYVLHPGDSILSIAQQYNSRLRILWELEQLMADLSGEESSLVLKKLVESNFKSLESLQSMTPSTWFEMGLKYAIFTKLVDFKYCSLPDSKIMKERSLTEVQEFTQSIISAINFNGIKGSGVINEELDARFARARAAGSTEDIYRCVVEAGHLWSQYYEEVIKEIKSNKATLRQFSIHIVNDTDILKPTVLIPERQKVEWFLQGQSAYHELQLLATSIAEGAQHMYDTAMRTLAAPLMECAEDQFKLVSNPEVVSPWTAVEPELKSLNTMMTKIPFSELACQILQCLCTLCIEKGCLFPSLESLDSFISDARDGLGKLFENYAMSGELQDTYHYFDCLQDVIQSDCDQIGRTYEILVNSCGMDLGVSWLQRILELRTDLTSTARESLLQQCTIALSHSTTGR